MHTDTENTMQTQHEQQQADTKPGAKPSTPEPNLEQFTRASARWLEASARQKDASAVMHDAIAVAHEFDPYLVEVDRHNLAACMRHQAENDRSEADRLRRRAADLVGREAPAMAAGEAPDVHAEVMLLVRRDRVEIRAALHMGRAYRASRTYLRTGASTWRQEGAEWIHHEDGLGLELAEFVDGLDFPDRVADMLPRPAADAAAAAARAASEARHG